MRHALTPLLAFGLIVSGCSRSTSAEATSSVAAPLSVGAPIELDPIQTQTPIPGYAFSVSVASDGTGYLATWCAKPQLGGDSRRYAARLDAGGQLLDDPPLALSSNSCIIDGPRGTAAVLHGSGGYLVVYEKSLEPGVGTVYDLQSTWIADDGTLGATSDLIVAPEQQYYPTLATSGSEMLLVFADARSGSQQVYAQRLSMTGAPLGAELQVTNAATSGELHPSVTFDGTNYFVVWKNHPDIDGIRIAPSGAVVDSAPMRLAEHTGSSGLSTPVVAAAGGNVLLAFTASNAVLGRVLSPGGNTISAFTLESGADRPGPPRATSNGTDFLVTWAPEVGAFDEPGEVRAARVSAAGSLLDADPGLVVSSGTGEEPFAASVGSDYLLTWAGEDDGSDYQVAAVSLSSTGQLGTQHLLTSDLNRQARPAAAFDGTNHLVVWQSQTANSGLDLVATHVGPGDTPLDAPTIPVISEPGDQYDVALVRGADSYLMTWTDAVSKKVLAVRLDDDGALIGEPLPVSTNDLESWRSDLAVGPAGFLAAYVYNGGIFARTLDTEGKPYGGQITLQKQTFFGAPAVAWGGYYLVTWNDGSGNVVGRRVTVDGAVIESAPFLIAAKEEVDAFFDLGTPAVAFGGGVFLVVLHESLEQTYFKRVTPDGTVLDATPVPLPDLGGNDHEPSVRFDGSRFVVAYGSDGQINVTYVSPAGDVSSEQGAFPAPNPGNVDRTLRLSSECGGDTLAVFSQGIDEAKHERAFARRITPETLGAADCGLPPALDPPEPGAGGQAGAAGAGGGTSAGGSAGAASGGAGTGGDAEPPGGSGDSSGCGCRVAGQRTSVAPWAGLLALALLFSRRRR